MWEGKHKAKFHPTHEQTLCSNEQCREYVKDCFLCIAEDTIPLPAHPKAGLCVVSFHIAP